MHVHFKWIQTIKTQFGKYINIDTKLDNIQHVQNKRQCVHCL